MNQLAAVSNPLTEAHRQATEQANCWRGRVVNQFARGELVIANALKADIGPKPLPMLLGQRILRLRSVISGEQKKTNALDAFDEFTPDRNAIVHGSGRVYVDGDGDWLLTLHTVERTAANKRSICQSDAEKIILNLKAAVDRLTTAFPPNSRTRGRAGRPCA